MNSYDLSYENPDNLSDSLFENQKNFVRHKKIAEMYRKILSPAGDYSDDAETSGSQIDSDSETKSENLKISQIPDPKPDLILITNHPTDKNQEKMFLIHSPLIIANSAILIEWYEKENLIRHQNYPNQKYLTWVCKEFSFTIISIYIVFCYTGYLSFSNYEYEELVYFGNSIKNESLIEAIKMSFKDENVM